MSMARVSCSFTFNGNSVFCLQIFNLWQKHSSLSSFALEPKTRLTPCGSRPTLQILVKTKARTSLALILTIKNSPGEPEQRHERSERRHRNAVALASVGGGALPFNARAKRTRTSESPTCTKKIAKICNKKLYLS